MPHWLSVLLCGSRSSTEPGLSVLAGVRGRPDGPAADVRLLRSGEVTWCR
jgi:hypothetical protein